MVRKCVVKLLLSAAYVLGIADRASADLKLADTFDSYNVGDLPGQGGWGITATATGPVQVAGTDDKFANMATSGQDTYKAFTSTVSNTAGTSFYYGMNINVTSAQTTGDYFAHVSNPAGTASNFYGRVFAKSATGGFTLGFVDASGTGATTTYGSTILSLSTEYKVIVKWNFVEGLKNDTFSVFVAPTAGEITETTPYLSHTWTSTTIDEPTALAAFNLRQGSATAAAALGVDDVAAGTTFADVAAVPEPASLGLLGIGATLLGRRRRAPNAC